MAISEQLKQERARRGLTQGEMANLIGVCRQAYIHLEHGARMPYLATLRQIADKLEWSDDTLARVVRAA